ncbi:hypothetical protein AMECASPLE_033723, partial [Ameca splendens]
MPCCPVQRSRSAHLPVHPPTSLPRPLRGFLLGWRLPSCCTRTSVHCRSQLRGKDTPPPGSSIHCSMKIQIPSLIMPGLKPASGRLCGGSQGTTPCPSNTATPSVVFVMSNAEINLSSDTATPHTDGIPQDMLEK